ncbi:MAG: DMT family transporter [Aestuariivirga sp.]
MNPRLQGIVLMLASMAVFTVLDSTAKYVMLALPPPVVVFFRFFFALMVAMAFIAKAGELSLVASRHLGLQIARGVMLTMSTVLNFAAISKLQLAQTSAIFFTIPLWVCALSVPLLGEKVGPRRWAAVIAGFLGVLVIMRPGTASFHWAMLLVMAAAICGSIYNILTRKVGGKDRAETSLLYVGLVGCAAAALPLPWAWQTPHGIYWLMLLLIGAAGGVGHLMLIEAHRKAPASALAPLIYTQIVWMILAGFLIFGDVPDRWTVFGAAIVVASGLFIIARERALARETIVSQHAE